MKMFEQTVESVMENSSGKFEIAAERNSRDQRADAVRDVTPLQFQFLGPKMETKNAIMLGNIWRSPDTCQESI